MVMQRSVVSVLVMDQTVWSPPRRSKQLRVTPEILEGQKVMEGVMAVAAARRERPITALASKNAWHPTARIVQTTALEWLHRLERMAQFTSTRDSR
jgi:hypothetical protein